MQIDRVLKVCLLSGPYGKAQIQMGKCRFFQDHMGKRRLEWESADSNGKAQIKVVKRRFKWESAGSFRTMWESADCNGKAQILSGP
jgi:hypothetical protein